MLGWVLAITVAAPAPLLLADSATLDAWLKHSRDLEKELGRTKAASLYNRTVLKKAL